MRPATLLAALLLPCAAMAACPSDAEVGRLAAQILANEPGTGFGPGLSLADGACAQDKLVARLSERFGPVIGWKAGLTAEAVQKRFGVPHPVRGALMRDMILADGATVPAAFGAMPLFESDLLVRVRDAGLAGARGHLEILRHLDAVIPFIELPDLVLAPGQPMDGPTLIAINVGARVGVVGAPVPVTADQDFADRLAAMRVILTDDTGRTIADSPGTAILGHPLDAVAWLVADLAKAGKPLRPGDLLSLGSFSPLGKPEAGRTVTARYVGLAAQPVSVSVSFR